MIRPGSDLQPLISLFLQVDPPWIHNNQLGSAFELFQKETAYFSFLIGAGDVASPEDNQFAGVVKIGDRIESASVDARYLPWGVANIL
jgi:hypothetical protein